MLSSWEWNFPRPMYQPIPLLVPVDSYQFHVYDPFLTSVPRNSFPKTEVIPTLHSIAITPSYPMGCFVCPIGSFVISCAVHAIWSTKIQDHFRFDYSVKHEWCIWSQTIDRFMIVQITIRKFHDHRSTIMADQISSHRPFNSLFFCNEKLLLQLLHLRDISIYDSCTHVIHLFY